MSGRPPGTPNVPRGTNVCPPRLRWILRRSGQRYPIWDIWCGWCRHDHSYSGLRYTREAVAAMHADHIEHICKPEVLDRESGS